MLNVERVKDAYSVIAGFPEEQVELENFCVFPYERCDVDEERKVYVTDCGTMFCGAGILAACPMFPEIHLHPKWQDVRSSRSDLALRIERIAEELFGERSDVFGCRGGCSFDLDRDILTSGTAAELSSFSDKEIMLYRLLRLLGWSISDSEARAREDAAENREYFRNQKLQKSLANVA